MIKIDILFPVTCITVLSNILKITSIFKSNEKFGFFEFSKKLKRNLFISNSLRIIASLEAINNQLKESDKYFSLMINEGEVETIAEAIVLHNNALALQKTLKPELDSPKDLKEVEEEILSIEASLSLWYSKKQQVTL